MEKINQLNMKNAKNYGKNSFISSTGVDYISLYKDVHERYLEDQYS